jgi:hypothetical protein
MSIEHDSLDVTHVGVVLESPTEETNLFAHFGHLLPILLCEKIQLEDALSDIWSTHDIDFKDSGLKMTLVWSVILESLKKESSAFLEFVEFKEHINDLINLSFWWSVISVSNHFCKSDCGLGINRHNLSKNTNEIWNMSSLLTVRHDLIKLIGLN